MAQRGCGKSRCLGPRTGAATSPVLELRLSADGNRELIPPNQLLLSDTTGRAEIDAMGWSIQEYGGRGQSVATATASVSSLTTDADASGSGDGYRDTWNGRQISLLALAVLLTALWAARWLVGDLALPEWLGAALMASVFALLPGLPVAILAGSTSRLHEAVLTITTSVATHLIVGQALVLWGDAAVGPGVAVVCGLTLAFAALAVATGGCTRILGVQAEPMSEGTLGPRVAAAMACALAAILFVLGCTRVDMASVGVFGVIALMRWEHILALAIASVVVGAAIVRRRFDPVLVGFGVATLVFCFAAFLPLVTGMPAFPTSFVHQGIIQIIEVNQGPVEGVDARFSWAGFFGAMAYLSRSAGLGDVGVLMAPAPLYVDLLLVPGLLLLARRLTGSLRLSWVAVVLFVLTNWFQQDYFAPQAVAFILYVGVLALLLDRPESESELPGWLTRLIRRVTPNRLRGRTNRFIDGDPWPASALRQPFVVDGAVLVALVAVVISHQITPMILVVALVILAALGALRAPLLPVVAAVIFVTWFSFGASDFWVGHLAELVDGLGEVSGSVQAGVADRLGSDTAYTWSQLVRIALSGGLYVLAGVGFLLNVRHRLAPVYALLAVSPFALVAVQSYGGEGVIRCFLLGSPFAVALATLAVARFVRWAGFARAPSRAVFSASAAIMMMALVLVFCRGLNASFEHTSEAQVRLTDRLLANAPSGSKILSVGPTALLFDVNTVDRISFEEAKVVQCQPNLIDCLIREDADYLYAPIQVFALARWSLGIDTPQFEADLRRAARKTGYRPVVDTTGLLVFAREGMPDPIGENEAER